MNYLTAFVIGGAVCAIVQIFIDKTRLTPARILVSLVVIGVFLTLFGVYEPFVKFAGAGATVPLLGFGYLLGKGVINAVDAQGALGVFTGGLNAASAGITATIVFGLVAAAIFKPKIK